MLEQRVVQGVVVERFRRNPASVHLSDARRYFVNLNRDWFGLAQALYLIKNNKEWTELGYPDFKALISREFPSVNESTIYRWLKVYKYCGDAIEAKIISDKDYVLPSYDGLCRIISEEDNLTLALRDKLISDLIEGGRLKHKSVMLALETAVAKTQVQDDSIGEVDDGEAQLEMIDADLPSEVTTSDDTDEVSGLIADADISSALDNISGLKTYAHYLMENLDPFLQAGFLKTKARPETKDLIVKLSELKEALESFIKATSEVGYD